MTRPAGQQQATILPADFSGRAAQDCELPHIAAAKNVRAPVSPSSMRCRVKQMRAGMMAMAAVVAIGLIWSVAVMSKVVPVDGSEMALAGTSRPAQ